MDGIPEICNKYFISFSSINSKIEPKIDQMCHKNRFYNLQDGVGHDFKLITTR